jgi:alkylation response protein AidB-like acyl-CoA dehydrogenase
MSDLQRSHPLSSRTGRFLTARPPLEHDGQAKAMTTAPAPAAIFPLDVARALAPRIRARADEIEAARELPADLVMDLAKARLFKVAISEAEGGLGADIITTLLVEQPTILIEGEEPRCPTHR